LDPIRSRPVVSLTDHVGRYHCISAEHKMKEDYEGVALAKAEAKGTKEVAAYHKKLAKDTKRAKNGK